MYVFELWFSLDICSVQFISVAQLCPTLCDPVNCSTPGLPVHHQLPEFTHTHVHRVGDAIQPSHPLSSPSPPAFNLLQHQGLFSESVLRIRWPKYWGFSFNITINAQENSILIISLLLKIPQLLHYPQKAWHSELEFPGSVSPGPSAPTQPSHCHSLPLRSSNTAFSPFF